MSGWAIALIAISVVIVVCLIAVYYMARNAPTVDDNGNDTTA